MNTSPTLTPPYKSAEVYVGPDESFVYYYWYNRSLKKYIREKLRLGIKGLSDAKRLQLLKELKKKTNKVIDFRNERNIYHQATETQFEEILFPDGPWKSVFSTFIEDLDIPETQRDLAQAFQTRMEEFLTKYHPTLTNLLLSDFQSGMIKQYIKFMKEELDTTGKTINNHLWILDTVMKRVTKSVKVVFGFSPEDLRVKQVKNETGIYKPLTDEEKEAVFSFFSNDEREYYKNYANYLWFSYYTCFRPSEIMRIQLHLINLKERTIHIPWWNAKNGLSNFVQILEPLYQLLLKMNLTHYHQDDYLFSHKFAPGQVKKSAHNNSELWNIAVKKLGIDKEGYGLKHTFNRDYVENNKGNIDWEWLRRHNRHATIQQTQDYISNLTAYFLDESIHTIIDHISRREK